MCDEVCNGLECMKSMGVIKEVTTSQWSAGMVIIPKNTGVVRICVDLKPLNASVLQEPHPIPKVDETLAQLSGATKINANSGLNQSHLLRSHSHTQHLYLPFVVAVL